LTTVMSSSSMKIATDTAISVHHLRSKFCSSLSSVAFQLQATI
jgi:hypothetical protein